MDPIALPLPAWLATSSSAFIDEIVESLGDDAQRLYRSNLAEEIRAERPEPPSRAWRALDATVLQLAQRPAGQP